jgi:hypothetical protein
LSSLAKRGRLFFLVLATLIVLDRGSVIVRAFTGAAPFRLLDSLLLPAVIIFIVVSLWQGDTQRRHFRALILLLYGGGNLFNCGRVILGTAVAERPADVGLFLQLSLRLMGFPVLHASCYIFAGLALLLSPSLYAFFDHQAQIAENPWSALANWLLGFVSLDRASREARQSSLGFEKRTRYPVLTRDILESLDDRDLFDAIFDYVCLKIGGDYKNAFAIVSSLPRGFQAVYSIWWVGAEISNGGFHQYFYNKGVNWAFMALEGYKLFGENEKAGLMARAIDVYLQEEPEQLTILAHPENPKQLIEQFVQAREASTLSELDRLFYETNGSGAVEYIRAHVGDFVAD